jgi:type I restriction enzyme, S subunit
MDLNNVEFSWINDIPINWSIERVKNHFVLTKNTTDNPDNFPILSLTMRGIIERDISTNEGQLPETYNGYNLLEENDIVFNPMDLISGWVDCSPTRGLISPSYKVIRPISESVSIKFYTYYFQTHYKERIFFPFGEGVHYEYRWGLGTETLRNFPIVVLPLSEQQQIVSFLDTKTSLIDSLIGKTQRKIELLKEKRTSLINEVVTKGLNPSVEMKDSGVEWIGEIPSHWETTKLKFQGDVIIGLSYSPENVVDEGGESTLVMRSSNVQNGKPSFHDNVFVNSDIPEKLRTKENDILICSRNGSRNLIGKNCLIPKENENLTWGVFMTVFRSKYPKFIYWLLNSPVFESQSGLFLTSTINQLTVSTLENMIVPFVSDVNEQQQIVEYLNEQTGLIDKTISIEERRIELLKEYRQSLISEVVTGKRKVVE